MSTKCAYGCGLEGLFTLKNGKLCCSEKYNKCSEVIKKTTKPAFTKIICELCGKEISKTSIKIHKKFCSSNECLNCGKKIHKNKKFCNKKCSGIYNNQNCIKLKQCRKGPERKTNPYLYCIVCNKLTSSKNGVCKKCTIEYNYKKNIEYWLNNQESVTTPQNYIRRYLLQKYNYSCQKCGWNKKCELSKKSPLNQHHIDGDLTNNKLLNLELLCPNCHSITPNYGSKNLKRNKIKNN